MDTNLILAILATIVFSALVIVILKYAVESFLGINKNYDNEVYKKIKKLRENK